MAITPKNKAAGAEATEPDDVNGEPVDGEPVPTEVFDPDTEGSGNPDDTTAVINDPSDDKVDRELAQNSKDAERPDNPVVQDNGVDLFAASDTGPTRQGNAYGLSRDAVENFKRDLESERDRLNARIEAIGKELDNLDVPDDNTNVNIAKQREAEAQNKDRSEI